MLTAEAAAEFQQRVIAPAGLVQSVPDDTHASFEHLRTPHSYGILCYDAFTTVSDLAPLVADLALRERFVSFYDSVITVVSKDGSERLSFSSVGDLVEKVEERKLGLPDWRKPKEFRGGFRQLVGGLHRPE